jgi:hypothetical protein
MEGLEEELEEEDSEEEDDEDSVISQFSLFSLLIDSNRFFFRNGTPENQYSTNYGICHNLKSKQFSRNQEA